MRAMLAAKDPAGAERAVSLLSSAVDQTPADAALHNLLAVAKINRAVVARKPKAPPVQDFISAAVLDPTGVLALRSWPWSTPSSPGASSRPTSVFRSRA